MKKHFTILFTIVLSLTTYAQIKFEKGYFVTNTGKKTECLIRNVEWRNNPTSIRYKLSENGTTETQSIKTIKEFGVYNISKYIRATVNIDRSSNKVTDLNRKKEPEFEKELLFLNAVIEGQASLFLYEEDNLTRFFFKTGSTEIKQLIHKEYLIEDRKIAENNDFKSQLYDHLKCDDFTLETFKDLNYILKDLERTFRNYNRCKNSDFVSFEKKKTKFNLNLRVHGNSATFRVSNTSFNFRDADFGNQVYFGLGAEIEHTFSFNKGKWSVIAEPIFKIFNSENEKETSTIQGGKLISKIDYKSLEIPFGIRHYMFINDKSKIFVNVNYIFNLSLNSTITFERANGSVINTLDLVKSTCYGIGLGYEFNDTYSIEFRHLTTRGLLEANSAWRSDLTAISLILGYKIF